MARERPLRVLWTWLDWLRVDHYVIKLINWCIAPLAGVVAAIMFAVAPVDLNLFGTSGLFYHVNGLLQILAGFFIASLAAVATFSREGLDEVMGGDPPRMPRTTGRPEDLTRRRFLCLLFGYLSGASILLYLLGAAAMLAAPTVHVWGLLHPGWHAGLRFLVGLLYGTALANMMITSFLGLYYLVDRIHRPNLRSGFDRLQPKDSEPKA